MDNYYSKQHEFYSSYYKGKTLFERNGFDEYPISEYCMFVQAINTLPYGSLRIIDIGCGNALLLQHIIENTQKKIIPFGIDFLSRSILEAKKCVLPEFAGNFLCINAAEYSFPHSFDLVLFDPSILKKDDSAVFFQRIIESKSHYCIIYCYNDVIKALKITDAMELLPPPSGNSIIRIEKSELMSLYLLDLNL
jgi:SAM-dependent methyltransferase